MVKIKGAVLACTGACDPDIGTCSAGFTKLNISPSWEVFPCEAFKWLGGKGVRPKVSEFSLAYIWENDPLLNLVRSLCWFVPEGCVERGCPKVGWCRGGCLGQRFLHYARDELIRWLGCVNPMVYEGRYGGTDLAV